MKWLLLSQSCDLSSAAFRNSKWQSEVEKLEDAQCGISDVYKDIPAPDSPGVLDQMDRYQLDLPESELLENN